MFKKMISFFKEEEGAGLAEYALLLLLIAVACIVALTALGGQLATVFNHIVTRLAV
jgi:pilus assembly protein Flp/PilA